MIRFLGYNPLPLPITRGQRVSYKRIARGWSRKRLALEAGIDEATVRGIEQMSPRVGRRAVLAVSRALTSKSQLGSS